MGKLPSTVDGFYDDCPRCSRKSSYLPYVAVRDSEENPDGTYTVDITCQRCLLNYQVRNYTPPPHMMPKK